MQQRILIHAPRGRDVAVVQGLVEARHATHICVEAAQLLLCLDEGAAALIISEEALANQALARDLLGRLTAQPLWSDLPVVVLASEQPDPRLAPVVASLHSLGNVMLLKWPLEPATLVSAADSAVRARQRQYAARQQLDEIERTRSREIAERENAQAALSQGQKMAVIGRVTGDIAHEFNNLLHVVKMNLELVSMYASEEKVKPVVERAKTAARRGAKLTGQLLSFARTSSLPVRLTRVNDVLIGMKDLLEISAGPGVEVEFELGDNPAAVVDASQLELALLNLTLNSRDAMPNAGQLKFSTAIHRRQQEEGQLKAGDYVVVTVSDTGSGIATHLPDPVFDPLFSVEQLGSARGLGLSQVAGFARQSGGLALIDSQSGKGTSVAMHLPMAPAGAQAQPELPPADTRDA